MTAKSIDMDMDQVVDYKAEYSQAIKKHTVSGSQLNGLCPFHDDRESSFSGRTQRKHIGRSWTNMGLT